LTEATVTQAVIARLSGCKDERTFELMRALIEHLHAFVREVEPTTEEWLAAIQYLTATGQECDDKRQEFILLSDTLGVSMLVDAINNRKHAGGTESSLLGPFYVPGAPPKKMGSDLAEGESGDRVTFEGVVRGDDGDPLEGAVLDIWQTAPNGFYDIQDPSQMPMHLRGRLTTGIDGRYTFTTLVPVSYPVPTDGPVGALLALQGRHPFRPAHTHFRVSADRHREVVTELFLEGDRYLDSDAVFGVKDSLVIALEKIAPGRFRVAYDFVLEPA
jgi:protocatechuate 3,4-dioxygenase beta subunit